MSSDLREMMKDIPNFVGVFAHDQLPNKKLNQHSSFIINLDDSGGTGTHWVAVYGKHYFDSFGVPPSTRIMNCMRSVFNLKRGQIKYLSHQIQDYDSNRCGYYCIHFIKEMSKHDRSFADIIIDDFEIDDMASNERRLKIK